MGFAVGVSRARLYFVFQTYMYVSQLILFHHDKTRHFIPDLISNPDPWRLDVQDERSTNAPSEGELTASVLMIIIKVKALIRSAISLLYSR